MYDILILGGGHAGLSAAICAARMNRRALIVERGIDWSRDQWARHILNYLGYPEGISARRLREKGEEQGALYGVRWAQDNVESLRVTEKGFIAEGRDETYEGRAIVLATGVLDREPEIANAPDFEGYDLHYCLLCDGYEMRGQRVAVIGYTDGAVSDARILAHDFDCEVVICTDGREPQFTPESQDELREHSVRLRKEKIARFVGAPRTFGGLEGIEFEGGDTLALPTALAALGVDVKVKLAQDLGVELNGQGYVKVDERAATNVPGFYAAGDITGGFNQTVVAAGQGAVAGLAAATDLRHTP